MSESLRSLINRSARVYSTRQYLVDPDSGLSLTYESLQNHCREFAHAIWSGGYSQGTKIGFLLDNGYWTSVIFLGTMYSGNITVPLNVVASHRNLLYAVNNADVEIVFVSENYRPLLDSLLEEVDREIQVVDVDMTTGFEISQVRDSSEHYQVFPITPQSTAMILHTSGTVGLPKGAVLSHSNLISGGDNVKKAHRLSLDDVAYCVLPLYHINGQVVTAISPLVSGSRVVMPRKFRVSNFWDHVEKYRCTWVSMVPTMAKYLLNAADKQENKPLDRQRIETLRFARSASSAMPAGMLEDFEQIFEVPMIETMGLTETAAPILSNPMPAEIRKPGSVGRPVGNEVKIIDRHQQEIDDLEIGEIVVRGQNVISQYYNAPHDTMTSFTHDNWFRTGDLGYRDKDGFYYVTGRIKELIIKGGENISPREIDDVLYHHTSILEAAAFGYPDETYGQIIAVAVVLKEGVSCTKEEIIEYCVEELGDFRCPQKIYLVDDLPKGPSGKIQRLEIANKIIDNPDQYEE